MSVATQTSIRQLADGREIAFDAVGPADGVPVFHCHSLFGCRLMPDFAEAAAERCGARLISPDRPGLGLSTLQPGRAVLDWPSDLLELADMLDIERFRLFGESAGSPYILASCLRAPDRVVRAAIAAGVTPWSVAGVIHEIVPKPIDALLMRSQLLARVAYRMLITGMQRQPQRAMASLKGTVPPSDRRVLDRPEISEFLVASGVEAARRGVRGWAYDDWLLNRPWGFAPADLTAGVPISLWWGALDTSMPLALGERLAHELPGATLHVKPQAGHFGVVFETFDEILADLCADTLAAAPTADDA